MLLSFMDPDKLKLLLQEFRPASFASGKYGEFFSGGFDAGPRISVADELKSSFDVLVDMNRHHTAAKGTSIATYGLCGCIGGYIDNPESNTLFHYDPLRVALIDMLARQHVSAQTTKVHFFLPGEWQIGADGKYELQPKARYTEEFLASTIATIRSKGVECLFHCYREDLRSGNDYLARSQGTAWIDKQGRLFAEGMPIEAISQIKPAAENPTLDY